MNETPQLSTLDTRILELLQRDASVSMADLARQANTSPATCWRRIKALEDSGVLGPQVRLVDPAAIGRKMDVFCQVRMNSQNAAARTEFKRAMELEPTIVEVYSISGEWDYLLHLLVRDMADFEQILMRRVLEHDSVAGTNTIFALSRVKHVTEVPV
ncbi:Lrp/AsnC family transcriptional regulator [Pelagimonas varians]|uniref:Leucine-responsive regulatory protein n=1 Tax=Pelagimonas varians TaxID=696760 RepID=A0A238KJ43_9RHOB|nr:Lrp/AsnC family transcriptional regulator [Pelagimonas varians]PYG29567.1 AsnC family transcriptional regulator [Pelagimonas varians]SMX42781.1 Leucine-responsive regulatory protein [Pelagimonas varians]